MRGLQGRKGEEIGGIGEKGEEVNVGRKER